MQQPFNPTQAYINNITRLWKDTSAHFGGYHPYPNFSYFKIPGAQWPNKLWFHEDVTETSLAAAFETIPEMIRKLSISYWDIHGSESWKILEAKGYELKSQATGMWLPLKERWETSDLLELKPVTTEEEVRHWFSIFYTAFKYHIPPEAVFLQKDHTIHYLGYYKGEPVATALLHITDGVAGIHSIGVLPEMRRKGLAYEIMCILHNQAIERACHHAVLHASVMGKDLYVKMGYHEAFGVRNYRLP